MIKTIKHAGNLYQVLGEVETSIGIKVKLRRVRGGREVYIPQEDLFDAQEVSIFEVNTLLKEEI